MYNTQGFAPKDAKIVRENPDKTPYDLLSLGISEKAYNRLIEQDQQLKGEPKTEATQSPAIDETGQDSELIQEYDRRAALDMDAPERYAKRYGDVKDEPGPIQPASIEQAPPAINKPLLSPLPDNGSFTTAKVVGPSGIPQSMNAARAQRLVQRYPQEYRIIK